MRLVIVEAVCADIKRRRALSINRPNCTIRAEDRTQLRSDFIPEQQEGDPERRPGQSHGKGQRGGRSWTFNDGFRALLSVRVCWLTN